METVSGTLMLGIFALASLPMVFGFLVWGLTSESAIGETTPALKDRYEDRYEKLDDLYTEHDARTGLRHVA